MLAHSGGGDFDKKGLVKRARGSDEMEKKGERRVRRCKEEFVD